MRYQLLFATVLIAFTGCTVYSPTVPSTPLVLKGQVEITASTRAVMTQEGSVAWSPINHLLLSGDAAFRNGGGNRNVNSVKTSFTDTHRQFGLGIGTYYQFSSTTPVYVAAVGGVGFATVNVHNGVLGTLSEYTAGYNRYHGQVYVAIQGRVFSGGISMRITSVAFKRLMLDNVPVAPIADYYLEPSVFVRAGKGALQSQLTLGISSPDHTSDTFDSSNLAANSTLFSLGLIFRPSLLKKRAQATQ